MHITIARTESGREFCAVKFVIQSVSFTLRVISVDGDMRINADGIMTVRRIGAVIEASAL